MRQLHIHELVFQFRITRHRDYSLILNKGIQITMNGILDIRNVMKNVNL